MTSTYTNPKGFNFVKIIISTPYIILSSKYNRAVIKPFGFRITACVFSEERYIAMLNKHKSAMYDVMIKVSKIS